MVGRNVRLHRVEKDEEQDIVDWAEAEGGIAVKLKVLGDRGFPDRTLMFPGGLVVFIETKSKTNQPSPQQKRWMAKLRSLGFEAEVCRSLREAQSVVRLARVSQRSHWRSIIQQERWEMH